MRFRNAFRLFLNNFKNTYLILLFQVVTFLVTSALAALILASGFNFLYESAEVAGLLTALEEVVASFFNSATFADFDVLFRGAIEGVVSAFGDVLTLLSANLPSIILSVLGLLILYLVNRFLNGLALFAFGDILNDKMSQFSNTPFFVSFFKNIGAAALYQVVYVPVSFGFDLLSVALCYIIFFRAFFFLPVLVALFFSATFLICAQAVKLAFISDWMPGIIVDGKKLSKSMRDGFCAGKKSFAVKFSIYLMAIYCILAFNVLFALTSFFSSLLITVPASFIFVTCLQFVNYYTERGKRYFISYTNICDTKSPEGRFSFRISNAKTEEIEQDEKPNE